MSLKTFKQAHGPHEQGRDISLNMDMAEAVTHVGGNEYLVTIAGNNHRIHVPDTNVADLHSGKKHQESAK